MYIIPIFLGKSLIYILILYQLENRRDTAIIPAMSKKQTERKSVKKAAEPPTSAALHPSHFIFFHNTFLFLSPPPFRPRLAYQILSSAFSVSAFCYFQILPADCLTEIQRPTKRGSARLFLPIPRTATDCTLIICNVFTAFSAIHLILS